MSSDPLACEAVDDAAAAFVLGALASDEEAAVREHLATCSRGHPELAELGGVVPYLALAADPVEPADALRARILGQLGTGAPRQPPVPASRPWFRGRLRWASLALAAVVIVALVGTSSLLAMRLRDAQDFSAQAAAAAGMAAQPGSRSISLAAQAGGDPSGTAVVARDGSGIVLLQGLGPTTGSQVYEVWLIAGAGAVPKPMGELHTTGDGRGWLVAALGEPAAALTVAVTREPAAGATKPTPPILAAGTAG